MFHRKRFICGYLAASVSLGAWMLFCPRTFAQAGAPMWTNRYNGSVNGDDQASAIAADSSGNVFVTGVSAGSSGGTDYATIKYSNTGIPLWTNRYNGPGNGNDAATAVAVDKSGNVFVTGNSQSNPTNTDYTTIKYSNAGVPLWTNRYDGYDTNDYPTALAVDGNGNVFVTGWSIINASSDAYATVGYSSAGVPLWTNQYIGPFFGTQVATAIALDTNGNVFVTGKSTGGNNTTEIATVAYSNSGAPLWVNRNSGPTNLGGEGLAIAADSGGNVFVAGSEVGTNGFNDYVVLKYSGAGIPLWTNTYAGPAKGNNVASKIALNSIGNAFVAGWSIGTNGLPEFATVAYSGVGVPLWTNRYSGSNALNKADAIAIDKSGNVFVTGWGEDQTTGNFNYATVCYSGAGLPLWTNTYVGLIGGDDLANAIAVDSNGNVFVAGESTGSSGLDYATIKYAAVISTSVYLNILGLNNRVVLSWTNAGYGLQAASGVTNTFTNVPGATSPYTNSITGAQGFFRLITN